MSAQWAWGQPSAQTRRPPMSVGSAHETGFEAPIQVFMEADGFVDVVSPSAADLHVRLPLTFGKVKIGVLRVQ